MGGTYTPHCTHEYENKRVAKWVPRKCMKIKRGLSLVRGRGETQNGNPSEAGVTRSSARVASINHGLCYHELHNLSNIIIVLVFSEMTSFVRMILQAEENKGVDLAVYPCNGRRRAAARRGAGSFFNARFPRDQNAFCRRGSGSD